jgi:hypothetical protein
MPVIDADAMAAVEARSALGVLTAGGVPVVGDVELPEAVARVLEAILEGLAAGDPVLYQVERFVPDQDRTRCEECGEPVELAYPDDPESWIHAEDASYVGDHSASVVVNG